MRKHLVSLVFAAIAAALVAGAAATGAQVPVDIPRTAAGNPDFSGLWVNPGIYDPIGLDGTNPVSTINPSSAAAAATEIPRRPTRLDLARELPLTDWAREQVAYWTSGDGLYGGETGHPEDPRFHDLCGGPSSPADLGGPIEISQNEHRVSPIYLDSTRMWTRQFWIGREHPQDLTDYVPTWMGHSVARWEGDTLVVETVRMKPEGVLLQRRSAAPQSEEFHLVERYQFIDARTMRVDRTFTDPKAYTRPWGNSSTFVRMSDWDTYADVWELGDQHLVCIGGMYNGQPVTTYPDQFWFENYDEIKVLPNAIEP